MCFTVCFSTAVLYAEDAVIDEPEKEVIIEDSIKIKATRGQDGVVSISWKSVSEDALYSVMRAQFAKGTYKSIGSVTGKAGAVSYKDTALDPAEIRYYKVVRLVDGNAVRTSNVVSAKMPLTPPASVRTSLVDGKYVKVRWNKVKGADCYKVFRSTSKNGTYKIWKTVTGTSYIDKKAYSGQGFHYKVRACKQNVDAVKSKLSASAAYYMKPKTPTGISAKNDNGSIKVSWKAVKRADLYYVYRKNSDGDYIKIGESKKLSFTDKKGKKNAFLYYKVRAVYKQDGKTITGKKSKSIKVLSRYVNPDKKMVALTFDDGPSAHTKAIVECLYNNNSAATFFVVGNRISSYKDTVEYTYKMGCELGNHSYSHPILTSCSTDEIKSQIKKTNKKIKEVTGKNPTIARVPGGGYSDRVKEAVDMPIIQWSDDTLDWKTRSKNATVDYVLSHVSDGDIVLMHDLHEPTKEAALVLIPELRERGYQIVTVSEMAKYKGYDLKDGTVYFSFR